MLTLPFAARAKPAGRNPRISCSLFECVRAPVCCACHCHVAARNAANERARPFSVGVRHRDAPVPLRAEPTAVNVGLFITKRTHTHLTKPLQSINYFTAALCRVRKSLTLLLLPAGDDEPRVQKLFREFYVSVCERVCAQRLSRRINSKHCYTPCIDSTR